VQIINYTSLLLLFTSIINLLFTCLIELCTIYIQSILYVAHYL